ncbi:MAG TPA: nuclear transport factor 2 family protein [Mycobacterium sp.]
MSESTPVELVTDFLRSFERFDFDAMPSMMTDDVRLLLPTAPEGVEREIVGREAFTAFLHQVKSVWTSLTLVECDVHAMVDDPTRVVAEYSSRGLNVDGSTYSNTYVTIVDVRAGKIAVFQEFFDPVPLGNAMQILAARMNSVE